MWVVKMHPCKKLLRSFFLKPSAKFRVYDIGGYLRIKIVQHFIDIQGVIIFKKSLAQSKF